MIILTLTTALASGLLLALSLIQWGTAQRSELLYFYLTLDKPGSSYFREARANREQYSRLALASMVLVLHNLILLAFILRGKTLAFATPENAALLWLQIFGQALLLYALFYPSHGDGLGLPLCTAGSASVALGIIGCDIWGILPASRCILLARIAQEALGVSGFLLACSHSDKKQRLPAWIFLLWIFSPLSGNFPLHLTATAAFHLLLVARVFRNVLERFESLEANHHRMQRQREVIVGFLERLGGAYSAALDPKQVLEIVAAAGAETISGGACAIYLRDPAQGTLRMHAIKGPFPPLYQDAPITDLKQRTAQLTELALHQGFAPGEGVVGKVAANGQPLRIRDARSAGILAPSVGDPIRRHPMLLVPLILRHEVLGVMAVLDKHNADEFTEEDQFLLNTLAEQAAFYIANARMAAALAEQERVQRELRLAREIQRLLLPADAPTAPGFDLSAIGRPALEMGGDYYDFIPVAEGLVGVVVADVSGKGVPAALTMAMLRTVMRAHAIGNPSVRDVLLRANAALSADLRPGAFITIFYGILDYRRNTLTWARAGHEPLIRLRDKQTDLLAPSGAAIGVLHPDEFGMALQVEETPLLPGERLIIYTDGITEAMNAAGEEFGIDRFQQTLVLAGKESAAAQITAVEESLRAFVAEAPQQDDITLVVLAAKDELEKAPSRREGALV